MVIGDGNKDLVQIRLRVEIKSDGTPYFRNLIEKSRLMGDLLAEKVK